MKYIPQVDDYVRWKTDHITAEGWVYFYDDMYITIETGIRPKPNCQYTKNERHKYIHTLLLCFTESPDCANRITTIRVSCVMQKPNRNHIPLELLNIV